MLRRARGGVPDCVRRMGAAGCAGPPSSALRTGPSSALRTGFDGLRANGVGKRRYDGEWGTRWGTEAPRAAPLWVPAFAGMTLVGECGKDNGGVCGSARAAGGGGVRVPLRWDGRFANRPYDGELGMRRGFGWGCAAPRPSGYRLSPVRRWGVRGGGGCWWWGGEGPAAAGRAVREPPLRRGVAARLGFGWGCAAQRPSGYRLSPVRRWGGVGRRGMLVAVGWGSRCGGTGGSRTAPTTGSWGYDGGLGWGAPRRAPLDTGFRRYDDEGVRGGGGCWWRWGEGPAAAGRAVREPPLRRGVGDAMGGWGAAGVGVGGWGRDFRFDGAGFLGIGCGVIVGWFALTLHSWATRLGQTSNLPRP